MLTPLLLAAAVPVTAVLCDTSAGVVQPTDRAVLRLQKSGETQRFSDRINPKIGS